MGRVTDIRRLSPEHALELARSSVTAVRQLAAQAEEQFSEAITRYNQAGGEFTVPEQDLES